MKSRKLSSVVMSILIIFSALAVMNITTMVVSAADPPPWSGGRTIENKTEWYENCNITMSFGNLTIKNNGPLVFNNSVKDINGYLHVFSYVRGKLYMTISIAVLKLVPPM